jgi:hypothetical protein
MFWGDDPSPSQVNSEDENQSINTTKDIPVVDNQVCKEVITSDTIQKVVQPFKVHDNIQTECVKPNTQVNIVCVRFLYFCFLIIFSYFLLFNILFMSLTITFPCSFGFVTFYFYICPCQGYFHFAVLFL